MSGQQGPPQQRITLDSKGALHSSPEEPAAPGSTINVQRSAGIQGELL